MKDNLKFPNQPETTSVQPPMVYVKEKSAWEYKLIIRNLAVEEPPDEEELNKLGADGWELAGAFDDPPLVYLYFKRALE